MPGHRARSFGPGATVLEADLGKLVEAELGLKVECVVPLASGLGLRRFYRVHTDGTPATLIARVEAEEDPAGRPASRTVEPPLEPLRSFLADLGLPVPARWGGVPAEGIDWLEDFGDLNLADSVARMDDAERVQVYREVLAWLPLLQGGTDAARALPAHGRRLDRDLLAYKGELFSRHSLPLALGREPHREERRTVAAAFARIADEVEAAPQQLSHRDLQSQNVMVREDASGTRRLGMIDFQGAFLAPPEYDLVSLLRDSYVELAEDEVAAHLDWIAPQLPTAPDRATLQRRFDLLTLARKGKDHARFVFALETRGDERWAQHLPRTARALHTAARRVADLDPSLERLADWIARLPESTCAE